MTPNLNKVRCIAVPKPTKEEMQKQLQKANTNTRTSLCKMTLPNIYTK